MSRGGIYATVPLLAVVAALCSATRVPDAPLIRDRHKLMRLIRSRVCSAPLRAIALRVVLRPEHEPLPTGSGIIQVLSFV